MQDTNINNSLSELKKLLEAGVLTQEEFENGKARLLSSSEEKDNHDDSPKADVEEKQVQVVSTKENSERTELLSKEKKSSPLRFWYIYILLLILLVIFIVKCNDNKSASSVPVSPNDTIEFIEDGVDEEFVDHTYKECTGETKESHSSLWESGFLIDQFGETDYSMPYIAIMINKAYYQGEEINNGNGTIMIQVFRNGISFRAYDHHFMGNVGNYISPVPVLFRTSQGDYEIKTRQIKEEAICLDDDDLKLIAQQLINGYFTIRVGNLLYKVTTECEGFLEAYATYLSH